MSKALPDLVVVDATTTFWASLGVALLADFGARVIKLELLPAARERRMERDQQAPVADAGRDYRFDLANRNKASLAVDPGEPAGQDIVRALVAKADVFVTDLPVSRLDEIACDYARLAALNPRLIYARASGLGPQGPDRDAPVLDELAAGRTGMMPILPQPGEPPVYTGGGQMYTSVMLAFGIATALWHRGESGEGQEVDVSLLGGNMYGASLDVQAYLAIQGDRFLRPISRLDAGNPMSGPVYPTQDGRWITLTMPDTARYWPAFAEVTGLDPDDPRFDTHEKRCEANRLEMIGVLDDAFRAQAAEHWRAAFRDRGLSGDVIEDYAYPADDPHARHNRYILELDDAGTGRFKTVGFPIYMSDTPARLRSTAPCLGQHTAEVLHDVIGLSEDAIVDLEARNVVA
jgi:crotonobetainyl-CoA:carnitine CoA-transferase CaiB-like acyl-CoA transferase